MDEVEFNEAYKLASSIMEGMQGSSVKSVLEHILDMLVGLEERISEMQNGEEEDEE